MFQEIGNGMPLFFVALQRIKQSFRPPVVIPNIRRGRQRLQFRDLGWDTALVKESPCPCLRLRKAL